MSGHLVRCDVATELNSRRSARRHLRRPRCRGRQVENCGQAGSRRREHVDAIYCAFIGRLRWLCRARGKREHSVVAFTSSFAGWPVADIKLHQLEHQAAESSSTAEHFSGVTEGGGEGRGGSCSLQARGHKTASPEIFYD